MIHIEAGSELRTMRLLANLSLKDVEKASGIHYSYLSRIERGQIPLTAKAYKRCLDAIKTLSPGGIPIPKWVTMEPNQTL